MILFIIAFKVEGAIILCEGKGELPKISQQTLLYKQNYKY
jgi:hypothetical protein